MNERLATGKKADLSRTSVLDSGFGNLEDIDRLSPVRKNSPLSVTVKKGKNKIDLELTSKPQ